MSEFECRKRHLMASSDRVCRICGEPVAYMDGMSGRQLAAQERMSREDMIKHEESEEEADSTESEG